MLIIGSQAMKHHGLLPKGRKIHDTDYICTFEEFQAWTKANKPKIVRCVPLSGSKFHVRFKSGWNFEFEIAWSGTTGEFLLDCFDIEDGHTFAPDCVLLALKLSHRYLKDSPHFLKNMRDIQRFRRKGVTLGSELEEWLPKREAETYVYKHPKLDVSKENFFKGDGVDYVYDHDSIHETVAIIADKQGSVVPAYSFYAGGAVWSSKELFFKCHSSIRLYGVYEESCVLALERSQIPHNFLGSGITKPTARWSFEMALMKVCSSITSGWFREYAWENYDSVMALYERLGEDDYVKRFTSNSHLLKPYIASMK
jgi:hypothetical protein